MNEHSLALSPGSLPALGGPQQAGGNEDPASDIRLGAMVAALFFVLFLGWAAFARLDAAANATGRLVVTGQRQTVQHRDGGVIGEILVP